jgi:hypothetical protein
MRLHDRWLALLALMTPALTSALNLKLNLPRQSDAQSTTLPLWVTVDASSVAHTITPTVTSVNGAVTTLSGAPASLTAPTAFVLTKGTSSSTTTLSPPVATATTDRGSGQGTFLVCNNVKGSFAPMCQPQDGVLMGAQNAFFGTPAARHLLVTCSSPAHHPHRKPLTHLPRTGRAKLTPNLK